MVYLKPCPFCGGHNIEVINMLEVNPDLEKCGLTPYNYEALCNDCFANGGTRRTAEEATEAWNTRVN